MVTLIKEIIMAERDINDAALGEMLHVTDIVLQ